MSNRSFYYCRSCIRRKILTQADYVLNDGSAKDWYICKTHLDLIKYDLPLHGVTVTALPQEEVDVNVHAADSQRKMENDV